MPRISGGAVIVATLLLAACAGGDDRRPTPTERPPTTAAPAPTAPPPPQQTVAPPPPPAAATPFSWRAAGAFVWHETDVDPSILGRALRESGFGWAVLFLHDGLAEDPVDAGWIDRFREASGLPVGGWGVLRSDPEAEAELAAALLTRYGLAFYVADAESDYEFSGPGGPSHERSGRSRRFVTAFRARAPELPAGLTSYCRADTHDIDWPSWRQHGFVFLPQAYVNELGSAAAPATCVRAAAAFFPAADVHPVIGTYPARQSTSAASYVRLLARAQTEGFSVYVAETVTDEQWEALGRGIRDRGIARAPS